GRAMLEERTHLHRRGVGAQQSPIGEIERVVQRPRRMIGRDVERFEVVEVVFDFRAGGDLEAGAAEQRLDTQPRLGDWVQSPVFLSAPRQRDVYATRGKLEVRLGALELRPACLDD